MCYTVPLINNIETIHIQSPKISLHHERRSASNHCFTSKELRAWSDTNGCPQDVPARITSVRHSHVQCVVAAESGQSQRHATVIPRLKKVGADPTDFQNYRPISNLTFMSKVVEKLVCRQLTAYLEENGLFPRLQSAYRRFHSTETGILKGCTPSSWSRGRYTTGSPRSLSCIWYCRS